MGWTQLARISHPRLLLTFNLHLHHLAFDYSFILSSDVIDIDTDRQIIDVNT